MIKFTVKSVKIIKEGEGEGGHWISRGIQFQEAVKLFEQDGSDHHFTSGSTFDTMASAMVAGEVWEAEAEINGKYLNLKKLNKVGASATQPAPTTQMKPAGQAVQPVQPAPAPTVSKGQPAHPVEVNGAARGMAVNVITELIVASTAERKLVTEIFGEKKDAVLAWYRRQLLSIAEIE